MNRFAMSNVALLMSYKVSPREIEKIVNRLDIAPADGAEVTDPQEVRVAAAQVLLRRYTSLTEYVADMNSYVASAVNQKAGLVCFPAFSGLLAASLVPQFEGIRKKLQPLPETGMPDLEVLGDFLSYYSDWMFDAFTHTMSTLAARHKVYIMAGSTLYFEQDVLCHRAFLFGSGGDLIGYQDKISLSPLERHLHLEPASEVKVYETPVGSVAMLIGEDADYFEIARVARQLGARILLHPTAITGEYTSRQATMGLNMRTQESALWGAQSALVGDTGLGFVTRGYSALFGPAPLTPRNNGVLVHGSGRAEPDILCATLSLERLSRLLDPYRQDCNYDFLEQYFDRLG